MNKKIKVLVMADNPFSPSGIGTQTKYMIEGLLKTGRYQFHCLAGAVKHQDYRLIKTDEWGDEWTIQPVDGYGAPEIIRSTMHTYRPDIVWFMTDPRFWVWLWEMDNEIRSKAPMVYYHVWDNYPYPTYNAKYYKSNDCVCTISALTDDIVRTLAPEIKVVRIPHTVDTEIFKKREQSEYENLYGNPGCDPNKLMFFWNNRNARRKQSGTLIFWFKEFLDIVGHDKASLIMHTEPRDSHGQDLYAILEELNLTQGQITISEKKMHPTELSKLYNVADCTINIADAEGFGLATLESLACETPIIVNMTGGLQEQIKDSEGNWLGIGLEPSSKSIIGSQTVPWIYEDRIAKDDFINSLLQFYELSKEEKETLGRLGRAHVLNKYSIENYISLWDETLAKIHEENGSWSNRKGYKSWVIKEL